MQLGDKRYDYMRDSLLCSRIGKVINIIFSGEIVLVNLRWLLSIFVIQWLKYLFQEKLDVAFSAIVECSLFLILANLKSMSSIFYLIKTISRSSVMKNTLLFERVLQQELFQCSFSLFFLHWGWGMAITALLKFISETSRMNMINNLRRFVIY